MCSNPVESYDNNAFDIPYTHFQRPFNWGSCDFVYTMDADFHMPNGLVVMYLFILVKSSLLGWSTVLFYFLIRLC